MMLSQLTRLSLAAAATVLVAAMFTVNPQPAHAGKGGGKPGGGGDAPPVLPVTALFEDDGRITITDGTGGPVEIPLTDAGLSQTNGHSHLPQTGNYTLQLGGGKGKKTTASDRELTFDFSGVLSGAEPADNPLRLNEMFMAFNRKYCRVASNSSDLGYGVCPADQWFNSGDDGSQPGLRDMQNMQVGEKAVVGVSMRPRVGPDYVMYCSESSNDTFGTAASDVTEFATAECMDEVDPSIDGDVYPGCKHWLVYGDDRNGDGGAMSCGLWLGDSMVGVFDMDFRLQLCREDTTADCTAPWPVTGP